MTTATYSSNIELLETHGILGEILSGFRHIERGKYPRGEVRRTIIYYVIEGARQLKEKPGIVTPTKDGGIELDRRAQKQFTSYLKKMSVKT